jgi:hypothetical protein
MRTHIYGMALLMISYSLVAMQQQPEPTKLPITHRPHSHTPAQLPTHDEASCPTTIVQVDEEPSNSTPQPVPQDFKRCALCAACVVVGVFILGITHISQ